MRTLVIYYSRTGTTRKLANALAAELNADIEEVGCDRYRPGAFRYLRAGYDSLRGNLPSIEVPQMNVSEYDRVLIGAPIWTSYPALPIRTFLASAPPFPARIIVFLTYGGHSPPDQAVGIMTAQLPRHIEAALSLRSDDVNSDTLHDTVRTFANGLNTGG